MKRNFNGRKWISALLALALCLGTFGSAFAATFGVVTGTNSLNLRAAGSSSSEWRGAYPSGTWVEIVGSQNNFYQVITQDGKTGYMSKNYINTDNTAGRQVRIATVANAKSTAYLNFRAAPSYSAKVLDQLYNGVPLLVLGEQSGWYLVQLNGQTGYVRSEYVTLSTIPGSSEVATIKTRNNSAMNLRSGPGKNYSVLRQFPGDTYVMVLAKGKDWWQVAVNGYTGYMDASFLKSGLVAWADVNGTGSSTGNTGSTGSSTGTTGTTGNAGTTSGSKPYAVVNNPRDTQVLNLRQSPSTSAAVLRKLRNGTELWVTEQGSQWCAVITKDTGVAGYVMTQYIRLQNQSTTAAKNAVVVHPDGTFVNLRKNPSLTSSVLVRVPHGRQVTVYSTENGWSKVQYNGIEGYMVAWYLK